MTTICEMHIQAELALAAYADLTGGISGQNYITALQMRGEGMSPTQAERFARDWRVVEQYNGEIIDDYIDEFGNPQQATILTGLSATVFEREGVRYLAVRGTAGLDDLLTDLTDIALIGTPERQLQYAALKAKVGKWLDDGILSPGFSVSGHSLGGFLAGALLVDYPTQIERAYLYNAPGAGGLRAALRRLLNLEYDPSLDISRVSNLRAEGGGSMISGLGLAWGTPIPVQIEVGPNPLHNHSIVTLTDALAVHAVYGALAPALTVAQVSQLLKSASNSGKGTLEAALDALRKTLLGAGVTATPEENRDALYANLYALQDSAAYLALKGSAAVRLTAVQGRDELVTKAKTDFGHFLAVKYLLPVAIEGGGSHIIEAHTETYDEWQADRALTAEQRASGQAHYSDEYLTDRAAFLTWKNKLASKDIDASAAPYTAAPDAWFRDYATNLTIHLGATLTNSTAKPRYLFGADQASGVEMLEGGSNDDHLYGGGGVDHLYGNGGNDHLEGGAGDDELYGGEGADRLIGGAGDDWLYGGKGFDTYIVGQGRDTIIDEDGLGVIKDEQGRIIAGAFIRGADGRYVWAGGTRVSATHNSPLTLTLENGAQAVIDNYDNFAGGALGIRLQEQATMNDGAHFRLGDRNKKEFIGNPPLADNAQPAYWGRDGQGRNVYYVNGPQYPADWSVGRTVSSSSSVVSEDSASVYYRIDSLTVAYNTVDGNGNPIYGEEIVPREDVFRMTGGPAVDWRIETGALSDFVVGGVGNDVIAGGADPDVLMSSNGDDTVFGADTVDVDSFLEESRTAPGTGRRGDWISGGRGKDTLVGTHDDDVMFGGGGEDLLIGGAGNDVLNGDDNYIINSTGITNMVGETPEEFLAFRTYDWSISVPASDPFDTRYAHVQSLDTAALVGGADVIFGGAGNDRIHGLQGNDHLYGEAGNDVVTGDGGADFIFGGDGNDLLTGERNGRKDANGNPVADPGDDFIDGGAGNDFIQGEAGNDYLIGGDGNDEVWGDARYDAAVAGDDYLDGGEGDDLLMGGGGADVIHGGAGNDTLSGDSEDTPLVKMGNDRLFGGAGDDVLRGYGGDDWLDGGADNDELRGDAGNDSLVGAGGNDVMYGGLGDDTYVIDAQDLLAAPGSTITGIQDAGGNNTLILAGMNLAGVTVAQGEGANGNDLVLALDDGSRVTLGGGAAGAIANYGTGDGALLAPVEFLEAANTGALDLHIDGDHARVAGGRGNDRLYVSGTGNTIAGGKGDDLIVVGGADNVVEYRPGDGTDTLRSLAATGTVIRFGAVTAIAEELNSQSPPDGKRGGREDSIHIASNNDNWRYAA